MKKERGVKMKRIIVACSSGVATSQLIASTVKSLLIERDINVDIEAIDLMMIDHFISTADVYISICQGDEEKYDLPVLNGIAFLTGIGLDEELEKLIKILDS